MSAHFVEIITTYEGELRCRATHGPSVAQVITDPPVDNHGKGESFSPTDLVATALGACMATIMGIFAQRHAIELKGMTIKVQKEMVQQPVRRIGKLTTEIRVPLPESHEHRASLERAALTCPVHQSLHPDVEKPLTFIWEG
jgi:putative redox protein